jgi:ATP-dependent protease ClpP protease subunit
MNKWFVMQTDSDTAVVEINTTIGGWFGIDPAEFIDALKTISQKRMLLKISSGGGSVFAGNMIYNALSEWKASGGVIVAEISGIAASMASIIAMVADKVRIYRNSFIMIHEAATDTFGNKADLERDADLLGKINDNAVAAYRAKTGLDEEYLRDAMASETWYGANEAVTLGFADEIIDEAATTQSFFNCIDFEVVPKRVIDVIEQQRRKEAEVSTFLESDENDFVKQGGGEYVPSQGTDENGNENVSGGADDGDPGNGGDATHVEEAEKEIPSTESVEDQKSGQLGVAYDEGYYAAEQKYKVMLDNSAVEYQREIDGFKALLSDASAEFDKRVAAIEADNADVVGKMKDDFTEALSVRDNLIAKLKGDLQKLLPAFEVVDDDVTWEKAVAEHGYAGARDKHPKLYAEYREKQKKERKNA